MGGVHALGKAGSFLDHSTCHHVMHGILRTQKADMASGQRARRKMCPCATLLVAVMCKGSLARCAAAQKPSTSLPPPPPSRPWNPLIPCGKPGMSAGVSNNGDTRLLVSPTKTACTVTVPDVTLKSSGFPGAPTQISRAGSSIGISSQGAPASQESAEGQHASSASSIAAASRSDPAKQPPPPSRSAIPPSPIVTPTPS